MTGVVPRWISKIFGREHVADANGGIGEEAGGAKRSGVGKPSESVKSAKMTGAADADSMNAVEEGEWGAGGIIKRKNSAEVLA